MRKVVFQRCNGWRAASEKDDPFSPNTNNDKGPRRQEDTAADRQEDKSSAAMSCAAIHSLITILRPVSVKGAASVPSLGRRSHSLPGHVPTTDSRPKEAVQGGGCMLRLRHYVVKIPHVTVFHSQLLHPNVNSKSLTWEWDWVWQSCRVILTGEGPWSERLFGRRLSQDQPGHPVCLGCPCGAGCTR
jgi:hypothetical protein